MGRQATVCTLFPPHAEVTLVWRTEAPPRPTLCPQHPGKVPFFRFSGQKTVCKFRVGGDRLPRQTKTEVSRTVVTRISAGKLQINSRCRNGPSSREILPTSVLEQFNDSFDRTPIRQRSAAQIENGFA